MGRACQGLGKPQTLPSQKGQDSNSLKPPPAHGSLQKPSSAHPACFKSARETREIVVASVGNRHTFLIPQLTKEPLPGFVGRSSTTPSRYSESSSTRMWWGLSRGLSSPRTAQSKEMLRGKHRYRCRCCHAPSLSGPALKWEKSWLSHTRARAQEGETQLDLTCKLQILMFWKKGFPQVPVGRER